MCLVKQPNLCGISVLLACGLECIAAPTTKEICGCLFLCIYLILIPSHRKCAFVILFSKNHTVYGLHINRSVESTINSLSIHNLCFEETVLGNLMKCTLVTLAVARIGVLEQYICGSIELYFSLPVVD